MYKTLKSFHRELVPVDLPYSDRQHYMHGFDLSKPVMLAGFEDYLEPVLRLCRAAGAFTGKAWMTVDERIVKAGTSQRRPGPHVDGQFIPNEYRWGHGPGGGWNHGCNNIPLARMPIIVASSSIGCRIFDGEFDAEPTDSGDLSHIQNQLGEGVIARPSIGYLLSPDCVHESMLLEEDTKRTFLRVALPVEYRFDVV